MKNRELLSRITTNSEVMLGKPVIVGTRLRVEYILKEFLITLLWLHQTQVRFRNK